MAFVLHSVQNSQRLSYSVLNSSAWKEFSQSKYLKLTKLCNFMCTNSNTDSKDRFKSSHADFQESPYIDSSGANENVQESTKFSSLNDSDKFGNMKKPLENVRKIERGQIFKSQKFVAKRDELKSNTPIFPKLEEANQFGNLSGENFALCSQSTELDEGEDDSSTVVFPAEKEYKNAYAYLTKMKFLVKERKIKEALGLFLHMKKSRIIPISTNYTFMIGACGRAGYTEMAFKLLRQMTDKGFRPTPATLTGLFNSCAECPFPEYGLEKAKYLKEKVELKNWQLTQISYHAMIKAFGKCGDIETAFQIVDEMVEAGIKPDLVTYNFLLMSCITDKKAGFTHAVEVWRKMFSKKKYPNCFSYNLLLRAARDCDVGPEEISCLLLEHWSSYTKRPYGLLRNTSKKDILKLPNPEFHVFEESADIIKNKSDLRVTNIINSESNLPVSGKQQETALVDLKSVTVFNLLSARPFNGPKFIELSSILTSSDRLGLLGGAEGFLKTMENYKVQPDIKTFSLLLECLPTDKTSEDFLVCSLDTYKVKPDTDFFNLLIKRRNVRKDYSSAMNTLLLINKYNLSPDIVSFGVLSMGCYKRKYGLRLLHDMKKLGFHPNVEIMGALVHNASRAMNFGYLLDILKALEEEQIKPDKKIISRLEEVVQNAKKYIRAKNNGEECEVHISQNFLEEYRHFSYYYSRWLQKTHVELPEHPWLQYKTDITEKKNSSSKRQSVML